MNTEPDAGTDTTEASEQLSPATGVKFTTAEQRPGSALTVISAGQVSDGSSVSSTVMSKEQVDVLPSPSVAVYVTVVVPGAKTSPGLCVLVSVTEQLSDAVGAIQLTIASQTPASVDTVISVGQPVITGNSVS